MKTIRQGSDELIDKFSVSPIVASALCRISSSKLLELEEIIIPDSILILCRSFFGIYGRRLESNKSIKALESTQKYLRWK